MSDTDTYSGGTLPEKIEYARQLADASLLPQNYRGKPGNVLLAIEYGAMLDVHPLTAIQQVHVIEGKLTMSAELMRAQVLRHGHTFRTLEMSGKCARVSITRGDDPDHSTTVEFTLADAATANLTGKNVWKQYPTAMLHARATSMIVRAVCPEVLMGISYTPEEIGGDVDGDGNYIEPAGPAAIMATQSQVNRIIDLSALLDDAGRAEMVAWKSQTGVDPRAMTPSQAAAAIIELERLADGGDVGVVDDDGITDAVIVEEPPATAPSTGGPATDSTPAAVVAEAATPDPGHPVATLAELADLMASTRKKPAQVMRAARDIALADGGTVPESFDRITPGPLLDAVCHWLRYDVAGVTEVPEVELPESPGGDLRRSQRRMHAVAAEVWGGGKAHAEAREAGRKALIRHVSAGRTDSSNDLDPDELDTVCDFLGDMLQGSAAMVDGVLTFTEEPF